MEKREFDKICKAYGIIDIEITSIPAWSGGWDGEIWSPNGKTFNASGCHCCVHQFFTGGKGMVYAALAEDIKSGLSDCEDPYCEYCEPTQ